MGEGQKSLRGQVDHLTAAIVMHSRRFEGWTREERQFVIQDTASAILLFQRAISEVAAKDAREGRVAAVKRLIRISPDGTEFLKKLMFFLIEGSELLTKGVYLTLQEGEEFSWDFIHEQALLQSAFQSVNHQTHLNSMMEAMSTRFKFSVHYGWYVKGKFITNGMFPGFPDKPQLAEGDRKGYTFWLAPEYYGGGAIPPEPLEVSRAEIQAIELGK